MSDWYPVGFLIGIGCVWFATAYQGHKLYHLFEVKYPEDARRLIPFAFSNTAHPEKLRFFFRQTSVPMLKRDPSLWQLRQRVKALLCLSILFPIASFIIFAVRAR